MYKPRGTFHEAIEATFEEVAKSKGESPDAGARIVADFFGKSRSYVYRWADDAQDGEVSFLRVCQLTEAFGVTAAAEYLSRLAGGEFVPVSVTFDADMPWCSKLASQTQHEGALHGAIGQALLDNRIDAREGACILELIDKRMEDMRRLRARVEAEMKRGNVVPVRMAGGSR